MLPSAIVGEARTVIVVVKFVVEELTHPKLLVPLIVYTVVAVGLTVKLVPIIEPGIRVYEVAPLGVMTELFPKQIVFELTEPNPIVGVARTVIVTVKFEVGELTHPKAPVPLIVYIVVANGLTVKLVPAIDPGISVYVDAPVGVIIEVLPLHIVFELTEPSATVGVDPTFIVRVAFAAEVLTQPVALVPLTV